MAAFPLMENSLPKLLGMLPSSWGPVKAELLAEAVRRIQMLIKWGGSIGNRQKAKA